MYEPWVGLAYDRTRLLILGESAYSWWEDDEIHDPSPQHSTEMVRWAIDAFPNCGRFFVMVSRALANEQNPTREHLEFVWQRVAFTNYISVPVGSGSRIRPSGTMWADAERDFLLEIPKLRPRRIIVLGMTMWAQMPDTQVYVTDVVQGYGLGDEVTMCRALNHPAGGLSWRELASAIHFTYETELRK
jgi:hypothetical protein